MSWLKKLANKVKNFFYSKAKSTVQRRTAPTKSRTEAKRKTYKSYGKAAVQSRSAAKTASSARSHSSGYSAYQKRYGSSSVPSVKKPVKKVEHKSAFEKFVESANKRIAGGGLKTTSRLSTYKKVQSENAKRAYEARQKAAEQRKKREQQLKASANKRQMLLAYDKKIRQLSQGAPYSSKTYKEHQQAVDILKKEREAVRKNFDEQAKKAETKDSKSELEKKLKKFNLTEIAKDKKKIETKAKAIAKAEKKNKLTSEEQAEVTLAAMRGRPEEISEKTRKKYQFNKQRELDTASSFKAGGMGFLSGAMPFGDYVSDLEKRYGIKLNDKKLKSRTAYKVGDTAGFIGGSAVTGAPLEGIAVKGATKLLAKKTGKKALGKVGKFVARQAGDVASGLPFNIADSAENADNPKEFAKELAKNTALDVGVGTALSGAGAAVKRLKSGKTANRVSEALVKVGRGEALDTAEKQALKSTMAKAQAKKITGREGTMTATEKAVANAMDGGKLKNLIERNEEAAKNTIKKNIIDEQRKAVNKNGATKIDSIPTSNADVGPVPTAKEVKSSLINNISESSAKSNAGTINQTNRRLTPEDDIEYLNAGAATRTKKKTRHIYRDGGKVVLHGNKEIDDYIKTAIAGKGEKHTVAYGKVNDRLAAAVNNANPNVKIDDYYLELVPADLEHAYKHSVPKEEGDLPLTEKDLRSLPKYVDEFDDLLSVTKHNDGSSKFLIGKQVNGYTVIVEYISNGRRSVHPKTAWKMDTDKYVDKYGITKKDSLDTNAGKSPTVGQNPTSLPSNSNPFSTNNIPESPAKSNGNTEISDESLHKYVTEMREKQFTDDDILAQFEKMGVNPQKAFEAVDNTNAKKYKEQPAKKIYERAAKGVSRAEIGQHYEKVKKQITEELGDSDFLKELELAERRGNFNKKDIMTQDEARAQAKREVADNLETTYAKVIDASKGDDEHLFYARASELVNKLSDNVKNGVNEAESSVQLMNVMQKINDVASESGRMLNSTKILLKATPEGRLRTVKKEVQVLSNKFKDRLDGKELELSEDQISRIIKAETDEEIEKVIKDINLEMWNQVPATAFEKINEFRHFAMLANFKTHIRNVTGNTVFKAARSISNGIEIALNNAAKGRIEKMGGKVDMVQVSAKDISQNKEYLNRIFDKVYKESGSQSKYIESVRPEGSPTIKFAPINAAIQANYKALEWEDILTFKPEFNKNYVRWCKAQDLDVSDLSKLTKKQHEAASSYAMRKAEEATFRDACALSEFITGKKSALAGKTGDTPLGTALYRVGNMVLESQLPFVKTPINVFRRSVDYSPVGLIRGVGELMAAKKPETFKQGLHHLATGLTGTGVFALGAYIASKDLITLEAGDVSGDQYYDWEMGYQNYSLKINLGGKQYSATIDWASPMNVSLFMGAQAYDLAEKDGLTFTDFLKGAVNAIIKPTLDMSFMSTAKDTVAMFMEQAYDYETGKMNYMDATLQMLGGSIPQGFLGSFVPQIINQTAQASDSMQRDTRSTKEDPIVKSWDSWKRKMINKFPVFRQMLLNPKVDRFGDDKVTGNNMVTRIINSFINPATTKEIKFTELDKELIDIYNHLPEETSKEKQSKKFFFYNFTGNPDYDLGDGKRMSYEALYGYGKEKRRQQTKLIEDMTKSKSYKNMTWEMKSREVEKAHWISQTMADKKSYGYKFATERIVKYSDSEKEALKILKANGGTNKDFVNFYITKERLLSRAHDSDYHTKALAVALEGNDALAKAYDINVDKLENAKKYLKRGGSEREYSNAMCNVISGIEKADVSISMANKAVSAAHFKINKRTYEAMGLSATKANMGIGLKKRGYTLESLANMKTDSKYNFDKDSSGTLNKGEMTDYINSLGLSDNIEKACLFEYLFPYNANNPFGSIPNYLDMKDTDSKGGYGGYRRYGRGYRRYGGYRGYGGYGRSSSGGSSEEPVSEFEKYVNEQMRKIQTRKIAKAMVGSYKKTNPYQSNLEQNLRVKKLDISDYNSDAYRKAVIKLLKKKLN